MFKSALTLLLQDTISSTEVNNFKNSSPSHYNQLDSHEIPNYTIPDSLKITTIKELQKIQYPEYLQIIHSLAHIEYNATKAYIDTTIRFISQIPLQLQNEYFTDLSQIAFEESLHFELCNQYVKYGTLPVHNNLTTRIQNTNQSLIGRLAVLSIVNEGRGMDTGQGLVQRLNKLEQKECAEVVKQIVKEEENHVSIGFKWFKIACGDLDPQEEFLRQMQIQGIKRNWRINEQKRSKAGFSKEWINTLNIWK